MLVTHQKLTSKFVLRVDNMSYEQDQACLQKIYDEFLSDENNDDCVWDKDYVEKLIII